MTLLALLLCYVLALALGVALGFLLDCRDVAKNTARMTFGRANPRVDTMLDENSEVTCLVEILPEVTTISKGDSKIELTREEMRELYAALRSSWAVWERGLCATPRSQLTPPEAKCDEDK